MASDGSLAAASLGGHSCDWHRIFSRGRPCATHRGPRCLDYRAHAPRQAAATSKRHETISGISSARRPRVNSPRDARRLARRGGLAGDNYKLFGRCGLRERRCGQVEGLALMRRIKPHAGCLHGWPLAACHRTQSPSCSFLVVAGYVCDEYAACAGSQASPLSLTVSLRSSFLPHSQRYCQGCVPAGGSCHGADGTGPLGACALVHCAELSTSNHLTPPGSNVDANVPRRRLSVVMRAA